MHTGALNLLVFREDRRSIHGPQLKRALLRELETLHGASVEDDLVRALLRAGELECAAADAGSVPIATYTRITNRLAEALVTKGSVLELAELRRVLRDADMPAQVEIARPEGFAFYALDPLAFARALDAMPDLPATVAVIGIRSIGTTLSAVVTAAARARGINASRITVRPAGHPYNRRTQFSPAQLAFVQAHVNFGAAFMIVDEGPGLSGSSFLSVAEALVEAGTPRERIILLCGHEPDLDSLRADGGPQRAGRFRWIAVSREPRRPAGAEIFVGGGEWRSHFFRAPSEWPESWISFERLKYLSPADQAQRKLFKFAGLGHYGLQVLEREEKVAAAGFGPSPQLESAGFVSYPWVQGRPMAAEDISAELLRRLAAYCAFRADAFATESPDPSALEHMAQHNLREMGAGKVMRLRLKRPVVADGRMQPHEWLRTPDGQMLKTDSGSHGDDHFFPGVTDIAWDLAGAIVEWRMNPGESESFLKAYCRMSGDDPRGGIADFVTAYAAFRRAYCLMAANALAGSDEQPRLEQAALNYQDLVIPGERLAA